MPCWPFSHRQFQRVVFSAKMLREQWRNKWCWIKLSSLPIDDTLDPYLSLSGNNKWKDRLKMWYEMGHHRRSCYSILLRAIFSVTQMDTESNLLFQPSKFFETRSKRKIFNVEICFQGEVKEGRWKGGLSEQEGARCGRVLRSECPKKCSPRVHRQKDLQSEEICANRCVWMSGESSLAVGKSFFANRALTNFNKACTTLHGGNVLLPSMSKECSFRWHRGLCSGGIGVVALVDEDVFSS